VKVARVKRRTVDGARSLTHGASARGPIICFARKDPAEGVAYIDSARNTNMHYTCSVDHLLTI
jgi:hypothetical protein